MDGEASRYDMLESRILGESSTPCIIPLEYLRKITNNFSDDQLLGKGGFGKVYKGVLQNGKRIAVKKLDLDLKFVVQETQFENEVYYLMRLKHSNIVRFVGYCYEVQKHCKVYDGKYIFAEVPERILCLEYQPNGSLDMHLSDESCGLDWHTRYRIIKGVCCGLHYLHEECKCRINASIVHLDLKPANILLDENMVPKVADFGLSRLFEDKKTQTWASTPIGSPCYMAPEYMYRHITTKADIYSLGVIIIEIITGRRVDPFDDVTNRRDFIESVLKSWRIRLEASPTYEVETECRQIESCLQIGLSCIKINRMERPTIGEIVEKLNCIEIGLSCIEIDHMERPTTREIIENLSYWESTSCYVDEEEGLPKDKILSLAEQYHDEPAARAARKQVNFGIQVVHEKIILPIKDLLINKIEPNLKELLKIRKVMNAMVLKMLVIFALLALFAYAVTKIAQPRHLPAYAPPMTAYSRHRPITYATAPSITTNPHYRQRYSCEDYCKKRLLCSVTGDDFHRLFCYTRWPILMSNLQCSCQWSPLIDKLLS